MSLIYLAILKFFHFHIHHFFSFISSLQSISREKKSILMMKWCVLPCGYAYLSYAKFPPSWWFSHFHISKCVFMKISLIVLSTYESQKKKICVTKFLSCTSWNYSNIWLKKGLFFSRVHLFCVTFVGQCASNKVSKRQIFRDIRSCTLKISKREKSMGFL